MEMSISFTLGGPQYSLLPLPCQIPDEWYISDNQHDSIMCNAPLNRMYNNDFEHWH